MCLFNVNYSSCIGYSVVAETISLWLYKYDKLAIYEYASVCPLKSLRNGRFFCARRKKFLYAYKIILYRDADNFSSRANFCFLMKRLLFCMQELR